MNNLDARIERERTRATYSEHMSENAGLPLTDRDIYRWEAQDARARIAELEALKQADQ